MGATPLRVLVLEYCQSDIDLITHELRCAGFAPHVTRVETETEYVSKLMRDPEIIVAKHHMPHISAMRALRLLKDHGKDIPFIVAYESSQENTGIEVLREGAWDILFIDRPARFGESVKRALRQQQLLRENHSAWQSLDKLKAILEATTDCVFIADPESQTLVYINRNGRKMIALDDDQDVTTLTVSDLHPDWANRIIRVEGMPTVLRHGTWTTELAVLKRDGREVPVSLVATAPRDKTGKLQCLAAIMHDITQRKQRQTELRERMAFSSMAADIGRALTQSENLQQMLKQCTETMVNHLDAAFARIWIFNPDDNVLELQASAGLYTHIDGEHARIPVGRYKIGRIAQQRRPHLTNKVQIDKQISDPEWAKRERMVAFAGYPLSIEDQLLGVVGMFARHELSKVTLDSMAAMANQIALGIQRKQAEEQLRKTNQQLESLIDTSPLAIIALDATASVQLWNPAAEATFGWTKAEVMRRPLPIIPEDQQEEFRAMFQDEMAGKTFAGMQLTRKCNDGSLVDVHLWTAPLRNMNGAIIATLNMVANVTERKKLQEQFRQAQKMEAIGRLAGGVAHDFNNLLTVINGFCELATAELAAGDPQ